MESKRHCMPYVTLKEPSSFEPALHHVATQKGLKSVESILNANERHYSHWVCTLIIWSKHRHYSPLSLSCVRTTGGNRVCLNWLSYVTHTEVTRVEEVSTSSHVLRKTEDWMAHWVCSTMHTVTEPEGNVRQRCQRVKQHQDILIVF